MEEYRLGVFKNRVLTDIFWPKREEVRWGWRKLHKEEYVAHVIRSEHTENCVDKI